MGFGDFLASLFGGSSAPAKPTPTEKSVAPRRSSVEGTRTKPQTTQDADRPEERLEVLSGEVVHIGDGDRTFAIVESPTAPGIVHPQSLGRECSGPTRDHLTVGQSVEFVVVALDPKKPGRYVLSLDLVREVRARQRLAALDVGTVTETEVVEVHDDRAVVRAGDAFGHIPAAELARHHVSSARDEVQPGDVVTTTVTEIECPGRWRSDRFDRRHACYFVGSLRPSLPVRDAQVEVRFGAVPFRLAARPSLPRRFDPVVSLVFSALVDARTEEDVVAATALTRPAVREIVALIEELGLTRSGTLTREGRDIADAIRLSEAFEAEATDGWFLSAAPPDRLLASPDDVEHAERIDGWPMSLYDPQNEKAFMRASEHALAPGAHGKGYPLERLLSDEVNRQLSDLHAHRRVRVFVAHGGGSRSRRIPVCVEVPDAWVLGLLWRAFGSAQQEPPFQPAYADPHADRVQVVTCKREVPVEPAADDAESQKDAPSPTETQTVFWEPATDTLWRPADRPEARLKRIPLRHGTPQLPGDLHRRLGDDLDTPFEFAEWTRVQHRPRSR